LHREAVVSDNGGAVGDKDEKVMSSMQEGAQENVVKGNVVDVEVSYKQESELKVIGV
jgi:hypothetical protein